MKIFLQALAMAAVLFVYGYVLSTAGHDHAAHQQEAGHPSAGESNEDHNGDHHHDHHGLNL